MKRTLAALACAVAAAMTVAACGSDGADSTDTGGGLTGAPVLIGVQAPMEGPAAYPQTGYGAQAAEKYINEKLGGINGRPVKIQLCAGDNSPETAINCANEFVSSNVAMVFDAYDGGVASQVPILTAAKIPIVGQLGAQGIADALPAGQAFYLSGPLETSALGTMTILNQLGKKSAALAVSEAPSSHGYVDKLIQPIAGKLGITVAPLYAATTNMNFSVIAATELSSNPDVAGIIALPEDGCTGLFKALRQQGYTGTIFAGSCSQFISALGKDAAGAIVQPRLWVPASKQYAPPEIQKDLDDFAAAMEAIDRGDEQSARSEYSFGGMVDTAKILSTIKGDITPASITTAMTGLKDYQTFAGPKVTCDGNQWAGRPSSCSHKGIFFEVQPDGSLKPIDPNGYIDLDPANVPTAA
jgi:branched-chain amino acid transport system substrate-binding protein